MYTKEEIRKPILVGLVAIVGIIVFHLLDNFTSVLDFLSNILTVFSPIIGGFVLAYLLNIPMKAIEDNLFKKLKIKQGLKRSLSLVLTIVLVFGFIVLSISFVLPQLIASLQQLQFQATAENFAQLESLVEDLFIQLNLSDEIVNQILTIWTSIVSGATDFMLSLADQALNGVSSLLSVIFNTIISVVLGLYILLSKERLATTFKKAFYAFTSTSWCDRSTKYIKIVNHSFENFIRGQVVEAIILGIVCYIAMLIFGFEYPLVISFLVGITNIIPLFGPYIGAVPSFLLLFIVNPISALWFIVFLIVLQQVESNLIYPKVVGSNMGISGFWIIVAVVIGNSLFGIVGILIGIPLLSSVYVIVKEVAEKRLNEKNITIE